MMRINSIFGGTRIVLSQDEAQKLLQELTSHAGEYVVRDGREISKEVPHRVPALRRLWTLLQE